MTPPSPTATDRPAEAAAPATPRPDWLWPNVLPAAGLLIITGPAGVGKSLLAADLAARVTTGSPWPDGPASPAGDVLVCPGTDSPDAIAARVATAGGDPTRVHALAPPPAWATEPLRWWHYLGAADRPNLRPLVAVTDRPIHTLHHLAFASGGLLAIATSTVPRSGNCDNAVEVTLDRVPGTDVRTCRVSWSPLGLWRLLPLPPPAFRIVPGPDGPRIRWVPAWPDRPRLADPVAARLFQVIADAGPAGATIPAQRAAFRHSVVHGAVAAARQALLADGLIAPVRGPGGGVTGHRSTVPAMAVQ
jgi:hypothetical protein